METKTADSRGRISLGKEFANKTFVFKQIGDKEMKLELAAVIPERELWLYKSPEAREAVLGALGRLKKGRFSTTPPDIDEEEPWMEALED
ncbi:MAG: hypothetical protein LDL33_10610 [Desulfomonile sp.]|nr:hypothetical protein [Desulfomonile sp.]